MLSKYLSIFIFNFYVSLMVGVKAAPQIDGNRIMTSMVHITKNRITSDEVHLHEGDLLELECKSFNNVTFIHPRNFNNIPLSPVKIHYHYNGNMYKATLKRNKTVYGDTGWYGCVDFKILESIIMPWKTLTPDNVEAAINWVYVYVKSKKQAFHNNVGKFTHLNAELGDNVLIPCRVNSPDYYVSLYLEDELVDVESKNIEYNPRKGFLIKNVTTKDSGYYQCFNNVWRDIIHYMLQVTKKLADMYNPVISKPEEYQLILGEELRFNCTTEIAYSQGYSFGWTTPQQNDRISVNDYQIFDDNMNSLVLVKELVVKEATSTDQGEYTCTVSATGKKTNSTKINVELKKAAYCSTKDLSSAMASLKDSILREIRSSLEDMITNAVEQSVSKNIEVNLASIKSKLDQYF